MDVDVLTTVEIARQRSDVAAYAADPSNAPDWYANIARVTVEGAGPLAEGSRMAFEAQFMGRRLTYTYEVTDLVPGERLVMRTAEGPFPMETTYTWTDVPGGGTTMSLRNRGRPSGFSSVAAPVMAAAMRRANRQDLRRLKSILEADSTPGSA